MGCSYLSAIILLRGLLHWSEGGHAIPGLANVELGLLGIFLVVVLCHSLLSVASLESCWTVVGRLFGEWLDFSSCVCDHVNMRWAVRGFLDSCRACSSW